MGRQAGSGRGKRTKFSTGDRSSVPSIGDLPPPVLTPLVTRVPREQFDFRFTDDQISQLEKAGGVSFSETQRRSLDTLADFWLSSLRRRLSARPGDFCTRLDEMTRALTQALNAISLNEESSTELEHHLLHWILEGPIREASGVLGATESQIEAALRTVAALKDVLPKDWGKSRPYGDERLLVSLADIFEDAEGRASIYFDSHSGKIADNPFRRFAQNFYGFLPTENKRKPGGLDAALRKVVKARRRADTSR
jgi:hypothetical protein